MVRILGILGMLLWIPLIVGGIYAYRFALSALISSDSEASALAMQALKYPIIYFLTAVALLGYLLIGFSAVIFPKSWLDYSVSKLLMITRLVPGSDVQALAVQLTGDVEKFQWPVLAKVSQYFLPTTLGFFGLWLVFAYVVELDSAVAASAMFWLLICVVCILLVVMLSRSRHVYQDPEVRAKWAAVLLPSLVVWLLWACWMLVVLRPLVHGGYLFLYGVPTLLMEHFYGTALNEHASGVMAKIFADYSDAQKHNEAIDAAVYETLSYFYAPIMVFSIILVSIVVAQLLLLRAKRAILTSSLGIVAGAISATILLSILDWTFGDSTKLFWFAALGFLLIGLVRIVVNPFLKRLVEGEVVCAACKAIAEAKSRYCWNCGTPFDQKASPIGGSKR